MPLSHEHVGSKIPAKIQIYILSRAEILITLCYEIPCSTYSPCLASLASLSLPKFDVVSEILRELGHDNFSNLL